MGREARCTVRTGGRVSEGTARLETSELLFLGDFRLAIPFAEMWSVEADEGRLEIAYGGRRAAFELGPRASRWAAAILRPPSLLDKLGIKPGQRVSVLGVDDDDLRDALAARGANVSSRLRQRSDVVIAGLSAREQLSKLARLQASITPDGSIWILWPRGSKAINENDIRGAAVAGELVDVKVLRFSDSLSALKLVIRRKHR